MSWLRIRLVLIVIVLFKGVSLGFLLACKFICNAVMAFTFGMFNLVFWILTVCQCPFPCSQYQGKPFICSVDLVRCEEIWILQSLPFNLPFAIKSHHFTLFVYETDKHDVHLSKGHNMV